MCEIFENIYLFKEIYRAILILTSTSNIIHSKVTYYVCLFLTPRLNCCIDLDEIYIGCPLILEEGYKQLFFDIHAGGAAGKSW